MQESMFLFLWDIFFVSFSQQFLKCLHTLPQKCLFEQKNIFPNFGEQPITLPQFSAH